VVGHIGGEQNRGTVGVEGVNSGQEMLDFFAYKHVSLGNCMCRRQLRLPKARSPYRL